MRRLGKHSRGVHFFSVGVRWGGVGSEKGIFFCALFSMCSHHVLMGFPKCSPRCSQFHLRFVPYGLPKVQQSCE